MSLDAQAQMVVDQIAALGLPPIAEMSVAEVRRAFTGYKDLGVPFEEVAAATDLRIATDDGEIPARVYHPSGDLDLPVVVYFHGGGWTVGDIDAYDNICRVIANRSESVVVSVEYRLAPEAPFPAAVNDCFAATQWVAENSSLLGADASRLAVAGDSAGGNLAAVVALMARREGGPRITFQLLIYPATDATMTWPSVVENADGYLLTKDRIDWYYDRYLSAARSAVETDWRTSPLMASDHFGLPPALIITAQYDPLRDEGEAYGDALRQAGVIVTVKRYDGLLHGFFNMAGFIDAARLALDETAATLKAALAV